MGDIYIYQSLLSAYQACLDLSNENGKFCIKLKVLPVTSKFGGAVWPEFKGNNAKIQSTTFVIVHMFHEANARRV